MIKKLRIQRFMSVEEATLEFSGINVFVGPTDSGKSVILRAIDAILSNTFPAARYAQHGSTTYAIAVSTEFGVAQLVKSRTTKYQVVYRDSEGNLKQDEFNAVGRDIPQEAKQVLAMPLLPISDTETLNVLYQSQHKPFFLITEDRATFSKVIALISNADKLRELEKLVNSDILINKRTTTQLKDAIADYDGAIALKENDLLELKPYSHLADSLAEAVSDSEKVNDEIDKLNELNSTYSKIRSYEETLKLNKFDLVEITKSFESSIKVAQLEENFRTSVTLIPPFVEIPQFAGSTLVQLSHYAPLLVKTIPQQVSIPDFKLSQIQELKAQFILASAKQISQVTIPDFNLAALKELRTKILDIINYQSDLDALHDIYNQVDSELSSLDGQICPVCGSILTKEHLLNS